METSLNVDEIDSIKAHGLKDLASAGSDKELDDWRVKFLGRKGLLTIALRSLVSLEPSERQKIGSLSNKTKEDLHHQFQRRKSQITAVQLSDIA